MHTTGTPACAGKNFAEQNCCLYRPYAAYDCVKLHSKQTYEIRMTGNIYTYEKFTVQYNHT